MAVTEKIAVKVVTSSADPGPIYSECFRNLPGFNRAKLKQDGGNPLWLRPECVLGGGYQP